MHIHILGICGTFMGGLAVLAKQQGYQVTGSDQNIYPPMSTQLEEQGIVLYDNVDTTLLHSLNPDLVIIGNAMTRGNPLVEAVLNKNLAYISGPQWLAENILQQCWVLAVAGTHGKTTTASMLAWILEYAQLSPSFLIGGVPLNFNISARMGQSPFFVIEADEYDTAFFDKRSKFIHYHPRTLILNNLEFDHADIFPDLDAIKTQFHHLVRTVPSEGLIIKSHEDENLTDVLSKGCWTASDTFGLEQGDWTVSEMAPDGSTFTVDQRGQACGIVKWQLLGLHNVKNALAAIVAARHVGVRPEIAIAALNEFTGVKRRLEIKGTINGITIYDDFAHHPTAIASTLAGLRKKVGTDRIIAVAEFGSFTMRHAYHQASLETAFREADRILLKKPISEAWDPQLLASMTVFTETEQIINEIKEVAKPSDHILIMSNKGFDNIHQRLLEILK